MATSMTASDAPDTAALQRDRPFDDSSVHAFVAKVGERVRHARQQKAISRRVLSEQSGVSQRYLAQLEAGTGNISVALLFKVAAALGHPPDWLLGEEDPWTSNVREFTDLFRNASQEQREKALEVLHPGNAAKNKARRICLIGLRGAGKSSLGSLLAKKLAIDFIELNNLIEQQSGMAVSEVMALYGQEGYRRLERQAVEAIAEGREAAILAVGGGIVSEPETFAYLLRTFHTVWLKASPEEHMQRVRQQGDERPMAGNPQAMEELKSILTSRASLYSRADTMVDTSGRTIDQSLDDLAHAVEGFGIG